MITTVPLYNGKSSKLDIIADKDITIIVPKTFKSSDIKHSLTYKSYYMAPIPKDTNIAKLDISTPDDIYNISYDIILENNVAESP